MTSPSKYESESESENENKMKAAGSESIQSVNDALDHSVAHLSEKTLLDIARVRAIALNHSNTQTRSRTSVIDRCLGWLFNPFINIGVPIAVAVVIAISVKYASVESIPELPLAMMVTEVPNEDFAMLEDLEFVTWLAENEQNALL